MVIILNLAGEGEDPEAVDINSLVAPVRPPRDFVLHGKPGGRVRVAPSSPAELLLPALRAAGFVAVKLQAGYATGDEP